MCKLKMCIKTGGWDALSESCNIVVSLINVMSLIDSVLTVCRKSTFLSLNWCCWQIPLRWSLKQKGDFKMHLVIYPDHLECIRNSKIIEGNVLLIGLQLEQSTPYSALPIYTESTPKAKRRIQTNRLNMQLCINRHIQQEQTVQGAHSMRLVSSAKRV